jgi:hypothetical protein
MNIDLNTLQLINLAIPVVFGLVGMVWGIIATILNHKSVPMSEVHAFLDRSASEAAKSETPLDDKAVEIAKTLFQQMVELGLIKETPAAPVSTTTTTTSETLYNPAEADRS